MYKYFISILLFFVLVDGFSQKPGKPPEKQEKEIVKTKNDSIIYKTAYGFRAGFDISKPILASINSSYSGLELVGDYRISKRFFVAAELGYEEQTTNEDYTNSTVKGSYAKLGFNYNAYENWLDMNNEIFVGFRYGLSIFDQTLNSYTPNVNTTYFPANAINSANTAQSLNAHWSEFLFGLKVETFNNFFVGASISYKVMISVKEPENFKTLYAPGFNTIYETSTGFGFNYTISYLIPFKKK